MARLRATERCLASKQRANPDEIVGVFLSILRTFMRKYLSYTQGMIIWGKSLQMQLRVWKGREVLGGVCVLRQP